MQEKTEYLYHWNRKVLVASNSLSSLPHTYAEAHER
jgi:hypothetical protein